MKYKAIDKTISDPIYLFHKGANYEAHRLFSPRPEKRGKVRGWVFRLWAPRAISVSVVGDFNDWNDTSHVMEKISDEVFEIFIKGLKQFDCYKYCITGRDGKKVNKSDPYAYHAETAPSNASKLYDLSGYKWKDEAWMSARQNYNPYESPINIYELHLGSWRRHSDGSVKNYRDIARDLIPYLKKMSYTHVEILPVTEFPFDGSWGYQVTGMFAPTSRFGTPYDFMAFVDALHCAGIGVIFDWVAAHFPKDEHGLYKFDGGYLYEYTDKLKREHVDWGTMIFDYGRREVMSFLISSAEFFCQYYHIDGIRVDAVASMLYLDYGRRGGEHAVNKDGGNYNLEAIEFLKNLNAALLKKHKGLLMIAEESTSFPMITKPTYDGGLGFNFKWNMGWMNDTLHYASLNPFFRKDNHNLLTFSMTYAYSENYVLPFSHDEVVHGKRSLVEKMPGEYLEKFAALRALMSYMTAMPGKKLLFMGSEFAQVSEWNYAKELDWHLLDYPLHNQFREYIKELNKLYISAKPLHELDCHHDGHKWIVVDDKNQNVIAFKRFDKKGDFVIAVINFSPVERSRYNIGVSGDCEYKVILNSDHVKFGGKTKTLAKLKAKKAKQKVHGEDYFITLKLPANGAMFIKRNN